MCVCVCVITYIYILASKLCKYTKNFMSFKHSQPKEERYTSIYFICVVMVVVNKHIIKRGDNDYDKVKYCTTYYMCGAL